MPDAFVIMQIGDADLDHLYESAIAPALSNCGLTPRRIDRDNEGGLLNAEIMSLIERSDIVIADLTNERPNCYLEVGYALGLGRSRNLLLTVRRDHLPGDINHVPGGPKVHFDLAGYDLLLWSADSVPEFSEELARRVQRRLAILEGARPSEAGGPVVPAWFEEPRNDAIERIQSTVGPGYMEMVLDLSPPKVTRRQSELLAAAQSAQIRTFGWPIGIVLTADDARPHPTGSGIRALVESSRLDDEASFDYWELRTDGDFFLIQSLFEDQRGRQDQLFFDTRIVRITEALLYTGRLYDRLAVSPDQTLRVTLGHGGLLGRSLAAATPGRALSQERRRTEVDQTSVTVELALGDIDVHLLDLVVDIASPLFELFDFFELGRPVYESIVDSFVKGSV